MPLFRCCNTPKCAPQGQETEFITEKPVCPKCGLDGTNPKYARFIERLTIIHFDPPEGIAEGVGVNLSLCRNEPPTILNRKRPFEQLTSDPEAVTCRECRKHDKFPKEFDATQHVAEWVGTRIKGK